VARIVLDTDVVSLYRAGRLPARFAHQVAVNDLSIAFATAGELRKWALARRWGGIRRGGLGLFLDQALILPADLEVSHLGRDHSPSAATWTAPAAERHLDRGLLYQGVLPPLTLNRRDFADFAEHDGLVLLSA
jgi:toxin FitB